VGAGTGYFENKHYQEGLEMNIFFNTIVILFLVIVSHFPVFAEYYSLPFPTNNDPSNQIRFETGEQAEQKRTELIQFIWGDSLPTDLMPIVSENVDDAAFAVNLSLLKRSLVAKVDQLEHTSLGRRSLMYLITPSSPAAVEQLAIMYAGHTTSLLAKSYLTTVEFYLERSYTVLVVHMIGRGWNDETGHKSVILIPENDNSLPVGGGFQPFLEPVIAAINYWNSIRTDPLDVTLIGLSGGGCETHLLAAVDTRIRISFPVAGSYPLYLRNKFTQQGTWALSDLEQSYLPLYAEDIKADGSGGGVATWMEIYALGGYGEGRRQVMITSRYDKCCFSGDPAVTVDTFKDIVTAKVAFLGKGQWGHRLDTTHKSHLISPWVLNSMVTEVMNDTPRVSVKTQNSLINDLLIN